ncbi:Oidioi.mRNA.OKI2018_I69.XSR.g13243.t1.cds [Oikopleura dioica]|uniref:Oidioi.mRNA.OKI2018_I69.XSR.g13243.t1.cds n=1 Tax=Oikopleura dioica TaxID=34765 RepID=A0ABN7S6B3_OIKDI|nr:Oidioi.mRNA.OKI2018_I69.XSR.g13243.t1.cds [Oikopleura dioica]
MEEKEIKFRIVNCNDVLAEMLKKFEVEVNDELPQYRANSAHASVTASSKLLAVNSKAASLAGSATNIHISKE